MGYYSRAANGLKKMFTAELYLIICEFFRAFMGDGTLVTVLTLGLSVYYMFGLYSVGQDIEGCKTAFNYKIACIVINLFNAFVYLGVITIIAKIVSVVLSITAVYFVCESVIDALNRVGDYGTARLGKTAWKFFASCYILMVILMLFANYEVAIIMLICSVVSEVVFLVFLYKSSVSLSHNTAYRE